jgi:very-short-patch-repair endonuclease
MVWSIPQEPGFTVWSVAELQHAVVARWQLIELGYSRRAIEHRLKRGRLHPLFRGVYSVGRPGVTPHGWWMASVLACGPDALVSHASAAALWGISPPTTALHVSVPGHVDPRQRGVRVHRRSVLTAADIQRRHRIPVTDPVCTLIDIATCLPRNEQEAAINEADKLGLIDPETLRAELDLRPRRPGIRTLRETLDNRTFTMTDSELERLLLPIARRAGLPLPQTQVWLNGYRVDFYWPGLGLVVETDGLTYHRTPAQQAADRIRDQAHAAAGLTTLRFTRAQVRYEPLHVQSTLAAVAARLEAALRTR